MKAPLANWWEPHALCPHPKGTQRMWMSVLFFWPPMGVPKQPPPFLHHSHWLSHLGVFANAQLKQHFRGLLMPLSFSFQPQATGPCLSFLWISRLQRSWDISAQTMCFPFLDITNANFLCLKFATRWISSTHEWVLWGLFGSRAPVPLVTFSSVWERTWSPRWFTVSHVAKTSALHKWCACYRSVFSSLQVSTKNCLGYYF